jgi:hypothetical protein
MYTVKAVLARLIMLMSEFEFQKYADYYKGDFRVRKFTRREYFRVTNFARLNGSVSLRGIGKYMKTLKGKMYQSAISNRFPDLPFPRPVRKGTGAFMLSPLKSSLSRQDP